MSTHPILGRYKLVDRNDTLDIVHLGDRNLVDNGNWAFDATADGDDIGVQPNWLPNSDQTGPQASTLAEPITVGNSFLSVAYGHRRIKQRLGPPEPRQLSWWSCSLR
ncbi:MAG: hypothetical protein AB8H80_19535 [Planctomycetota bacterium]